jgi:hypothetical protein
MSKKGIFAILAIISGVFAFASLHEGSKEYKVDEYNMKLYIDDSDAIYRYIGWFLIVFTFFCIYMIFASKDNNNSKN